MNRLAILDETVERIQTHLAKSAPREEGLFCLLREGKGKQGLRLLVGEPIFPPSGAWERQDTDQLRPTAQWLSAVVGQAIEAGAGLLFIHSHPQSDFPPGLSPVDEIAFQELGRTIAPMLDGPFAAAVVHPSGWSGVVWAEGVVQPIERIFAVSRTLRFLSPISSIPLSELDARQRDALGIVHDRVRSLHVAVVGVGGLGSPMAEQFVRMGVTKVTVVDPDSLDTPSNVRRVFGSTMTDLTGTVAPTKVSVVERHLNRLGLDTLVEPKAGDVRVEDVFRTLLDADVVMVGTDTHGSRAVVNDLASTYLLPVIDVGVRVGAKANQTLAGLVAEVRILTPTTPCLWCRGSIDADVIRAENLPVGDRERLKREGYIQGGIGDPVPSVVALTVLGSGLATCALLSLLAEEGEVSSSCYWVDGFYGDAGEVGPKEPKSGCRCRMHLGLGDSTPPSFITEPR